MADNLYVETNFLISFASGRNAEVDSLLNDPPDSFLIAIPGVCFMEAFSVLNAEHAGWREFDKLLSGKSYQFRRNVVSPGASELVRHLDDAIERHARLLDAFQDRLSFAMKALLNTAILIESGSDPILSALGRTLLGDPTDGLILETILEHATAHPADRKAFLSENKGDFGLTNVQNALRGAGITYFSSARNFLGWHAAGGSGA